MRADAEVADVIARSFLGKLPANLLAALRSAGERTDYRAGGVARGEGSNPYAALVVRGLMRTYMTSPEGRQVTIRYIRQGDVVGLPTAIGGPVSATLQAMSPSSLFSLDWRALIDFAQHDAHVAWAIAEELNRLLHDLALQTAINAFGSVRQRVATHLLDLASSQQNDSGRLDARVSQQELADAVGSVREVVTRVLREWRLSGVIETSSHHVLILDAVRLHREAWAWSSAPAL